MKIILTSVVAMAVFGVVAATPVMAGNGNGNGNGNDQTCPDGTSAVVIDTGTSVVETCVSDDLVADADAGEPVTLTAVTCPCAFEDLISPRRLRRHEFGQACEPDGAVTGFFLSAQKNKPFSRIMLQSGKFNVSPCLALRETKRGFLVDVAIDVTAEEAAVCHADMVDYVAKIRGNDSLVARCDLP